MKNEKALSNTRVLTEAAMMVAMSIALFVVSEFVPWPWAFGGSVTIFGQVPLVVLSYRHGIKVGIPAALVLAMFELIMGLKNFSYVKGIGAILVVALFDYLIAFGGLGLGGIFRGLGAKKDNKVSRQVPALVFGGIFVCLLRFACHFLSGITVWKDYAPSNALKAVLWYSFTYNGAYMLAETIITVVGVIAVGTLIDLRKKRIG